MASVNRPVRVMIACPGLGLVDRGYERAARGWFDNLRHRPELEVTLVKGGGPRGSGERVAPTIQRDAAMSRALTKKLDRHPFWLEYAMFQVTAAPMLMLLSPDVVMLSEWQVASAWATLRSVTRRRFRILLSNGGPKDPPFHLGLDFVQQLTPECARRAEQLGFPADRQTVLPYGVDISARFEPPSASDRTALRHRLRLPAERRILLSVAAINATHKRVDYVVSELAAMGEDRPFLVLLGARDRESDGVLEAAQAQLGSDGYAARTVPMAEVSDYYRAADVFVLASDREGFGLAWVEALAHGLPALGHDFATSRFVLGEHGYLADLTCRGALSTLLADLTETDSVERRGQDRHRSAYERFSWDVLTPAYVAMIESVAALPTGGRITAGAA